MKILTETAEVPATPQGRRDRRRGDEDGFGAAMTAAIPPAPPKPAAPSAPEAPATSIGDAVRTWLDRGALAPAAPGPPAPATPETVPVGAPPTPQMDAPVTPPASPEIDAPTSPPPPTEPAAGPATTAVVELDLVADGEPAPAPSLVTAAAFETDAIAAPDPAIAPALPPSIALEPPQPATSESLRPEARGLRPVVGREESDDAHGRIRHGVAEISIGEGDDRIDLRIAAHGPHVRVTAVADDAQMAALRDGADELAGALSRHGLHLDLSTSGRPHHSDSHTHDGAPDEPPPDRDDDDAALAGVRVVA